MIRPLFKCFGSKWNLAKHYPLPMDAICEPFPGGAGYSCYHSDRYVILLPDANPEIRELWPWLIKEATFDLVHEIPLSLPAGTDIRSIGLTRGQALLLKHWQRTNNHGPSWVTSPWGHMPGQWTANTRARVSEEIYRVKHWRIFDYWPLDFDGITHFVDPPYQYNYRYGAKLAADFYTRLGADCMAANGHVIACEAMGKNGERPDWLPFVDFRRSVTSRRKPTQSHHSAELIFEKSSRRR